jgi:DNA-directed RNA polymerase specialized sigma24 family protein
MTMWVARSATGWPPEDAKDVLQETLLTMARGVHNFRGASSLSTSLYTIARNACIKMHRRSKFAPEERALEQAIAELEPMYHEVLLLRDAEGLTAPEVAEVLGLTPQAVKSRLHRARLSVRERVAPLVGIPTDAPAAPGTCGVPRRRDQRRALRAARAAPRCLRSVPRRLRDARADGRALPPVRRNDGGAVVGPERPAGGRSRVRRRERLSFLRSRDKPARARAARPSARAKNDRPGRVACMMLTDARDDAAKCRSSVAGGDRSVWIDGQARRRRRRRLERRRREWWR